jgi:polysaccharidase protein
LLLGQTCEIAWNPDIAEAAQSYSPCKSLALPISSASKSGRTLFLDSRFGNDANQGTSPEHAWKSFRRLRLEVLSAGDKLELAHNSVWSEPLIIRASGSLGNPVVVSTYGSGARPLIASSHQGIVIVGGAHICLQGLAVSDIDQEAIYVNGVGDLFIEDFEISNTGKAKETGAISLWHSTDVTIQSSSIIGAHGDGIWAKGLSGLMIAHVKVETVTGPNSDNVQIENSQNVSLIKNNLYINSPTDSIKGNIVINRNKSVYITRNKLIGGSFGISANSDDLRIAENELQEHRKFDWSAGILVGEVWSVSDVLIENNIFYNETHGIFLTAKSGNPPREAINVTGNHFRKTDIALKVNVPVSGSFTNNVVDQGSALVQSNGAVISGKNWKVEDGLQ